MNDETIASESEQPNAWLLGPIGRCIEFMVQEHVLCGLTERGILALTGLPALLDLATERAKAAGIDVSSFRRLTAIANDDQKFAKDEIERGHPTLLAHSSISLWSAIEMMVESVLVNHLKHVTDSTKLVVQSLNFEKPLKLDSNDLESTQIFIKRWNSRLSQDNVVDRYLCMLKVFHLSYEIDSPKRQCLTELSEARNIILHNASRVDSRFLRKVPWKAMQSNAEYRISRKQYVEFYDAVSSFALNVLGRATKSPWIFVRAG